MILGSLYTFETGYTRNTRGYTAQTHFRFTTRNMMRILGTFQVVLQKSPVKETYDFREPTNRSHPIVCCVLFFVYTRVFRLYAVSFFVYTRVFRVSHEKQETAFRFDTMVWSLRIVATP